MSRILLTSAVLGLLLGGCDNLALRNLTRGSVVPGQHAAAERVHYWHPLPGPGERITLTDDASAAERPVQVLESYNAASGRTCSLYRDARGTEPGVPTGLACRGNDHWIDLPLLVRPDARVPANPPGEP